MRDVALCILCQQQTSTTLVAFVLFDCYSFTVYVYNVIQKKSISFCWENKGNHDRYITLIFILGMECKVWEMCYGKQGQ